jgi:hypothetical protein
MPPDEQQDSVRLRDIFKLYLYDPSLDKYLKILDRESSEKNSIKEDDLT